MFSGLIDGIPHLKTCLPNGCGHWRDVGHWPNPGEGLGTGGADVVPTGRRQKLVEGVACEIMKMGRKSLAMTCDVADRSSIEELCMGVLREFGKVDILVNSAGITQRSPVLDFPESDWNRIININLNGTLARVKYLDGA